MSLSIQRTNYSTQQANLGFSAGNAREYFDAARKAASMSDRELFRSRVSSSFDMRSKNPEVSSRGSAEFWAGFRENMNRTFNR